MTSQDIREEYDKQEAARNYRVKTLWDPPSEADLEAAFEKQLEAQEAYVYKTPWQRDVSTELPAGPPAPATGADAAPVYRSLWAEDPIPAARLEQIRSYKIDTPFQTEDNVLPPEALPPVKYTPTVAPYLQGAQPGPPVPEPAFPQPATALWTISEEDKPKMVAAESSGDPILDSLRQQLRNAGADGICGLARKFRIMDDDGSGTLDGEEFRKAMKECRLNLTERQLKHLFSYFDKNDSGDITYEEFLVGIRGVLNSRRRAMVHLAYAVLDKDGSGQVDMEDFKLSYNCTNHPDVLAGKMTEEQCLNSLMANFEVGGEVDGFITKTEFENYYANVSASVDSDDYFELMIRNAWHISGGEGACANSTNKRVLVTHADGSQTVEEVKNDMGLKAGDKKGLVERLRAQGVAAAAVNTDGSGGIDEGVDPRAPRLPNSRRGSGASAVAAAPASSRPVPLSVLAATAPPPSASAAPIGRPNGSVGSAGSTPRSVVVTPRTGKPMPLSAMVAGLQTLAPAPPTVAQGSGANVARKMSK